jgi:hypothetical protein
MEQGTNVISCTMNGQQLLISGLLSVLTSLGKTSFLYLTVSGLINPTTSLSQSNFSFTFINTTSSTPTSVLQFTLPISSTVSNPPLNMQISNISLSNNKYFVQSSYTFSLTSVNSASLTIANQSLLGLSITFPQEYSYIWTQISTPSQLNLTINGVTYSTSNVQLSTLNLFARFANTTFSSSVVYTSFSISFQFRNPNQSIDCTVNPVFTISLFDFKGNSIYAQTLSNNIVCPTFTTYLYGINITGNTKIPAGSSETFTVSLSKPALNLTITPSCTSSAISFTPSSIQFLNYVSTSQTFAINVANGLSGSYNVTYTKVEGNGYIFYNDIQYTTLSVYVPTTQYPISIVPFNTKSIGSPIVVTINLTVANPTDFALLFTQNCSNGFTFNPSNRISVPAKASSVTFSVTYSGTTIPTECTQSFTISSLTANNYIIATPNVYYSASVSIDKSSTLSPMLLQLTTTPVKSTSVGYSIVSSSSSQASITKYTPKIYTLVSNTLASNIASFNLTTSYGGTIYFAVVPAGTPAAKITSAAIYSNSLTSGITYGSGLAALDIVGVNIRCTLNVTQLSAQTNYTIVALLNSTIGISEIFYFNFTTAKLSNGAAITIAMNASINQTAYINALSTVLRIDSSRIYILTNQSTLSTSASTFNNQVMNNRYYIYDTLIAPNPSDDSISPYSLLSSFVQDTNAKAQLVQFMHNYVSTYNSNVRNVSSTVPQIRYPVYITTKTHDSVTFTVSFWDQAYVYAVILKGAKTTMLSAQVINGLNNNNTIVVT